MADLNVVPLHDGPSLQDIPGCLRNLADMIERGVHDEVHGLLVIMPREHQFPVTFAFGVMEGAYEPIVQLELAREWHVRAAVGLPVG